MAKKHLGQNFLKSKKAIMTMIKVAEINSGDTVVEIGPGKGAITEPLIATGASIIALEKDSDLIPILGDKFACKKNFTLQCVDVLEFNTENLGRYKVVANIPYYITGAIIRYFLENKNSPTQMVLLVQKEVAERIVARNGKESILSLSVKVYGEPKRIMNVSRKDFKPSPKVDSAIISIENISNNFFNEFSQQDFFRVIKQAFQFKRKTLCNNLKKEFPSIETILIKQGFTAKTRAEDILLTQWKEIIKALI